VLLSQDQLIGGPLFAATLASSVGRVLLAMGGFGTVPLCSCTLSETHRTRWRAYESILVFWPWGSDCMAIAAVACSTETALSCQLPNFAAFVACSEQKHLRDKQCRQKVELVKGRYRSFTTLLMVLIPSYMSKHFGLVLLCFRCCASNLCLAGR
jgi:hypothetical protein